MRIERITPQLLRQIERIRPADDDLAPGLPCRVVLDDGQAFERVYLCRTDKAEDRSYEQLGEKADELNERFREMMETALEPFGSPIEVPDLRITEEVPDRRIPIERVVWIEPCRCAVPASICRRIRETCQAGADFYILDLVLADGRKIRYLSRGAFEFLDLPDNVTPAMIVDAIVLPAGSTGWMRYEAPFHTCDYRLPEI